MSGLKGTDVCPVFWGWLCVEKTCEDADQRGCRHLLGRECCSRLEQGVLLYSGVEACVTGNPCCCEMTLGHAGPSADSRQAGHLNWAATAPRYWNSDLWQ